MYGRRTILPAPGHEERQMGKVQQEVCVIEEGYFSFAIINANVSLFSLPEEGMFISTSDLPI